MTPEQVQQRMKLPSREHALANANFRMAEYLCEQGHTADAVSYFKEARRLRPESWNYTRQAFAMSSEADYGTTFVEEVAKLNGKLYYDLLDLDGTGHNAEQEQVAREAAERLRGVVESQGNEQK